MFAERLEVGGCFTWEANYCIYMLMPEINRQKQSWSVQHFTDLNALINILGKGHIILRATNISYLNDIRELEEGIDAINTVEGIDIQSGAFRNYYITSFSSCEDDLTMWGMYAANGSGCALSFDFDMLSKSYEIMARCIYGEKTIHNHLKGFLNLTRNGCIVNLPGPQPSKEEQISMREASIQNIIISTCLSAKNEAYSYEKETRGIIHYNQGKLVKFRVRNNYVVPFIEVPIPKEALTGIIIGPTNNSELTMKSIMHLLQINGYDLDKISIKQSRIPYRG